MMNQNTDIFNIHANFCTVLSNEKRLRIMWLLGARGEMSVGEIAETLDISMANASQHLRVMRDQNAVHTRKDKQSVFYKLSNQLFFEGCQKIQQGLLELHLSKMHQFETEGMLPTVETSL